jgi:hypothetical protein
VNKDYNSNELKTLKDPETENKTNLVKQLNVSLSAPMQAGVRPECAGVRQNPPDRAQR